MSRILVNNMATFNVLPTFILKNLGKKKFDMLLTNLIMTNFCGSIAQPLGILSIKLSMNLRTVEKIFFVIKTTTTYNALLE